MAISGKGISAIDALDSISGASTTDATIAASDKILFQDADDSDNVKSDTVQGILDLVGGGSGKVVNYSTTYYQTAFSTTSVMPFDSSTPQNTEGSELVTLSITPTSATNKLIIKAVIPCSPSATPNFAVAAIFQDSTVDALSSAALYLSTTVDRPEFVVLGYEMTSGTTSSTTFKIRVGTNNALTTVYVNQTASLPTMLGGDIGVLFEIYELEV